VSCVDVLVVVVTVASIFAAGWTLGFIAGATSEMKRINRQNEEKR